MSINVFSKLAATTLAVTGAQLLAVAPLQLRSDVFVERQVTHKDGKVATILAAPKMVTPGDNLVFVLHYKNVGTAPTSNFVVTNPLPKAVLFNGTSDGAEMVSIDGGKTYGTLSQLRVASTDGKARPASMADVTHIKWNLSQTLSAGSEGKLMFRGVVK